jgi:hypothetical protein
MLLLDTKDKQSDRNRSLLFIFDEAARNNHHQWQNPLFHHS